ncbi:phage protein NinX family protein, partial [Escherichia coli]|uniref:phage protein NinX family protein n=1 Tax=Escherichia coli TaxID=562 RepID=UPI0032B618B0
NPLPDYCNDPSASWPIIEKYRISIINLDEDEWGARGVADCKSKRAIHENPLRAAMIVFLMMQRIQ